ncbi:uncharacterized protein KGF55_003194 [Candida pseudojiufengensis]|uniref:uncharacterized protein n=1 Tax=Candida pseudojiufengensis TaxID=497109 RepID=UPI00222467F4|nr:uncharacterized protein KGF55_003194 [Candida pseudojiufengensis]KAI5962118.1 hypothetical protein KGF55_003194 [Candida pseudojiufengensis]
MKLQNLNSKLKSLYHISIIETLFIGSFLLNFFLSRLIHFGSPIEEVYNYYNQKGNFFNQFFVKRGWGWTTLLIVLFYAFIIIPKSINKQKVILNGVIRYFILTIWWILFTQWCFGLPIMDKVFVFTGGVCQLETPTAAASIHQTFMQDLETLIWKSSSISSYHCRKIKGKWSGGHDPSGHVFLLVQASIYLFFEIENYINWVQLINDIKLIKKKKIEPLTLVQTIVEIATISLIGLWWFMLLMTNVYFHSILEKLVGLGFGYFGVTLVYIVSKWFNLSI